MNRAEHLAWAKQRALEYVDQGEVSMALTSLVSDLGKHPETRYHQGIELGMLQVLAGRLPTSSEMRDFIEGCR